MEAQNLLRKTAYYFLTIAFFITIFSFGLRSQAAVFDGGEYSSGKISSHTEFGSGDPEPQPTNFAFEEDRFSAAPVGKPLYVLGDDHKCYWGNFAFNKYEKALIVYYKSPVSTDRCIYQKQPDAKPSGFSISAKMGGVCVPTLGVGDNSATDWKLEEMGTPVAFSECVDQTVSYGDIRKDKGWVPEKEVAQVAHLETPGVTVTDAKKTIDTPVAEDLKKRDVAGSTETPSNLGPSVQETSTPWNSGAKYRQGFPSLNNESKEWHDKPTKAEEVKPEAKTEAKPETKTETAPQVVSRESTVTKSSEGEYTVQLLSFVTPERAKREAEKLAVHGLKETWVMTAEVGDKTVYRVCVGHFKTGKEARAAQPQIAEQSGQTAAFVQKIVVDREPSSL